MRHLFTNNRKLRFWWKHYYGDNKILILLVIQQFCIVIKAQKDVLERVKTIKVMYSARKDVERLFGKPSELPTIAEDREIFSWYINDSESIEFTYSNGKCTDGWMAPKDTVISIQLNFKEYRSLSELNKILKGENIKLNKLRAEENVHGVKESFYDDPRGVSYGAHLDEKIWRRIRYYPSAKYSHLRCED